VAVKKFLAKACFLLLRFLCTSKENEEENLILEQGLHHAQNTNHTTNPPPNLLHEKKQY